MNNDKFEDNQDIICTTCYVGIDCGGTSTTISVYRYDGILLFESKYIKHSRYTGFANANEYCEYMHIFILIARYQMIIKPRGPFLFVSMVISGLNTTQMKDEMTNKYKELYPDDAKCVTFVHDSFGPAYAVFPNKAKCLVLISGTGSIATLISKERIVGRCGGHGFLIDDYGSSFDLSNTVLKMLVLYFECLNNITYLRDVDPDFDTPLYIFNKTNFTINELDDVLRVVNTVKHIKCIDDIYQIYYPNPNPAFISSFASAVGSAAYKGTPICIKLIHQCAKYLAKLVVDLIPNYVKDIPTNEYVNGKYGVNVVCSGSFLNNFGIMKYEFFKELNRYHDPDSIYLRMLCVNEVASYGAAYYGYIKYNELFPDEYIVHRPKTKPKEILEIYTGTLSEAPMYP